MAAVLEATLNWFMRSSIPGSNSSLLALLSVGDRFRGNSTTRESAAEQPGARTADRDDVAEEMRMQQVGAFDEVQWAIPEANGPISFVKK